MNSKRRNSDSVNFDRRLFLGGSAAVAAGLWMGGGLLNAPSAWAVDAGSSAGPIAETTAGKVRGRMEKNICAFRGIPYGASTEGAQRASCRRRSRSRGPAFATPWKSRPRPPQARAGATRSPNTPPWIGPVR